MFAPLSAGRRDMRNSFARARDAYHHDLAADYAGAPEPESPCLGDVLRRGVADYRVSAEGRSVASWRTAYVSALADLGAANRRVSDLTGKGWDVHAVRRQYVGAALRNLNAVRKGLRAAERRFAAAEVALSALSLSQAA